MLLLKSTKENFGINVPTDIKEINAELLEKLTANINIPNHHVIIALAYKAKLFDLTFKDGSQFSGKDARTFTVVPIIAKANDSILASFDGNIGDVVIVEQSALERGTHIKTKHMLNMGALTRYVTTDPDLFRNIRSGTDGTKYNALVNVVTDSKKQKTARVEDSSPNIYFIELKIVYQNDIKACFTGDDFNDPSIVVVDDEQSVETTKENK